MSGLEKEGGEKSKNEGPGKGRRAFILSTPQAVAGALAFGAAAGPLAGLTMGVGTELAREAFKKGGELDFHKMERAIRGVDPHGPEIRRAIGQANGALVEISRWLDTLSSEARNPNRTEDDRTLIGIQTALLVDFASKMEWFLNRLQKHAGVPATPETPERRTSTEA